MEKVGECKKDQTDESRVASDWLEETTIGSERSTPAANRIDS
jgi:hypothetical protein